MNDSEVVNELIVPATGRIGAPARTALQAGGSAQLVGQWACFDEAAFTAARRLERALDAWDDAAGPAPTAAEVHAARRLRFVANHRLRWILFQTRRTQAGLRLL